MKKFLTLILLCLTLQGFAPNSMNNNDIILKSELTYKQKLIIAIAIQESGRDSLIVNKSEDAVGYLQIRKCYLNEANRLSLKKFKYEDRYSKQKSIEIFEIIMNHWASGYDLDSVACVHNSGGYDWNSTIKYRNSVKQIFKTL